MIRRGEEAEAEIVVDNLDVVQEMQAREPAATETMFPAALLGGLAEIRLADFIAANLMFERTFSFGYMKPIFERAFLSKPCACATTRRCASARTTSCSLRPWRRAGDASSSRASAIPIMSGPARFRACSNCIMSRRCWRPMRPSCATISSMRRAAAAQARRTRSLEEAASFLTLVQHLKDRAPLKAVGAALRDPVGVAPSRNADRGEVAARRPLLQRAGIRRGGRRIT